MNFKSCFFSFFFFFRTSFYLTNIRLNNLFIFKYWCCRYYRKTLSKNSHIGSDIWMCQFSIKTSTKRTITVWQVKEKDVTAMVSWSGYRPWSKELHLSSNHLSSFNYLREITTSLFFFFPQLKEDNTAYYTIWMCTQILNNAAPENWFLWAYCLQSNRDSSELSRSQAKTTLRSFLNSSKGKSLRCYRINLLL